METRDITPNEGEGRELSTHGKKKLIVTFAGATVLGAAIGAVILGGKPQPKQDPGPQNNGPQNPVADNDDDDPNANLTANNDVKNGKKPDNTKKNDNPDEPKPTDVNETDPKNVKKDDDEINKEKDDDKDVVSKEEQAEIDKITEDLINGSQVDEHDMADIGGLIDYSTPVTVSLPNGLETTGYYYSDFGDDLVLLDLDGDGVFSDVKYVDTDGSLKDFEKELHLNDGSVLNYKDWVASNHITSSDIEQVLNDDGSNDLSMTDDDRRRMENDNAEEDIVTTDDADNLDGEENVLTKEEEDALLKQLLSENEEDVDAGNISDEELEAILIDTKPITDNPSDNVNNNLVHNDMDDIDDDINEDIYSELN